MNIESLESLEDLARQIGESPALLRRRFQEARSVLSAECRPLFTRQSRFCFVNKRMYSICERYALQWRMRHHPDLPVCYNNQQTNRGVVVLIKV